MASREMAWINVPRPLEWKVQAPRPLHWSVPVLDNRSVGKSLLATVGTPILNDDEFATSRERRFGVHRHGDKRLNADR